MQRKIRKPTFNCWVFMSMQTKRYIELILRVPCAIGGFKAMDVILSSCFFCHLFPQTTIDHVWETWHLSSKAHDHTHSNNLRILHRNQSFFQVLLELKDFSFAVVQFILRILKFRP